MKIIDKKRVVTIDCTDYNNETLFLGYSSDVNSTLLCFLINSEYLGNNFNYRVVFSRGIAGEDDKSINISNISIGEGAVKCALPAAITHYSNTDSQQGHRGTLQLFIYEQSSSQNNETTQVELVAASPKFPYIIENSLNLEAISSADIDVDLWTDLEDTANKIKNFTNNIDTEILSDEDNHVAESSLIKSELDKKMDLIVETSDEKTVKKYQIYRKTSSPNFYAIKTTNKGEMGAQQIITAYQAQYYAKKEELPKKTSELENDSGFLTQHQDLSNYAKKEDLDNKLSFKEMEYEDFNSSDFDLQEDTLYEVSFSDGTYGKIHYITDGINSAEFNFRNNGIIEYRTKINGNNWSSWKNINNNKNSGIFEATDDEEKNYKASGYYELTGNYCNLSGTAKIKAGLSSMIFVGIPYRSIYGATSIEYPISDWSINKDEGYIFSLQNDSQETVDLCVFPLNTSTFLSDKIINFNISYKYK